MPFFAGAIFTAVLAFAPLAEQTEGPDGEDGYVEIDFCTVAPERRIEAAQQQLQDAWYGLDVHGRAVTGGFNPHSANFGEAPIRSDTALARIMEWRHLQIRRLMVKVGALFPQFNHPMDVPALSARMWSRSVPASNLFDLQTAMMEVFLTSSGENGSTGYEFVEALGDLENDLLSLESANPAPEALANLKRFQEAFPPFMTATKAAIMSPALTNALTWRMPHMCEPDRPAGEASE